MKTYFYRLFFLCVMLCFGFSVNSFAQTRAYRYSHNVTEDGIKVEGLLSKKNVFHFIFSNGNTKCYLVNARGEGSGTPYEYVGSANGMHIYIGDQFWGEDILYFSEDFKRLNWKFEFEYKNSGRIPSTRVLNYVSDPNAIDVPDKLY